MRLRPLRRPGRFLINVVALLFVALAGAAVFVHLRARPGEPERPWLGEWDAWETNAAYEGTVNPCTVAVGREEGRLLVQAIGKDSHWSTSGTGVVVGGRLEFDWICNIHHRPGSASLRLCEDGRAFVGEFWHGPNDERLHCRGRRRP